VRVTQIQQPVWPSGRTRPIAVLRLGPDQLSARYGVRFHRERDDLDEADVAAVQLPSGRSLLFVRYRGNPSSGTEVAANSNDDPRAARSELLEALNLDYGALKWTPDGDVSQT
jgi:hypothetical protein